LWRFGLGRRRLIGWHCSLFPRRFAFPTGGSKNFRY
jgi:hypothetical protein